MMADDIYADFKDGDDATGDGTSAATAYKHISRALADVTFPLTDSQTIKLVGDTTAQDDYNYQDSTDQSMSLNDLEIQAGGELVFEPDGWDESTYMDGEDSPITGATDGFDPTETKPCIMPPVYMPGSKNIIFRGLKIANDIDGLDDFGIYAEEGATAEIHYCQIEGFRGGIIIGGLSKVAVYNCYFLGNNYGVAALNCALCYLLGINHIKNSLKAGIVAYNSANVFISCWDYNPNTHYRTRIYNTEARNTYAAIHGMKGAKISIGSPEFFSNFQHPMNLQILNEVNFSANEYFGIKLESGAGLFGTQYISFAGKDQSGTLLNQGEDTVPAGQQIVQASGEGTFFSTR